MSACDPGSSLEERLERGELVFYPSCPFPLPEGDDQGFLLGQHSARWGHKNISYNPRTGRVTGFSRQTPEQAERLRRLLAGFSQTATSWLTTALPRYAGACEPDRASLRPEEEAVRSLRWKARNDLLHVDAFPTRPTHGRRILRLFANLNPSDPRVWVTSEPFAWVLEHYGPSVGLPRPSSRQAASGTSWLTEPGRSGLTLFPFLRSTRSVYDQFMLRLHDFLKANEEFQERSRKRFWSFPPGSAWLLFSDLVTHAVLRGQHALEHSWFIAPEALVLPDEAPAALLARLCAAPRRRRAA